MIKVIGNRVLLVLAYWININLIIIMFGKQDTLASLREAGISPVVDQYAFLDVVLGWPVIAMAIATIVWITIAQLKMRAISAAVNAWAFVIALMMHLLWLGALYFSI